MKVTVSVRRTRNLNRCEIRAVGADSQLIERIEEVPCVNVVAVRNALVDRLAETYSEVVAESIPNLSVPKVWRKP